MTEGFCDNHFKTLKCLSGYIFGHEKQKNIICGYFLKYSFISWGVEPSRSIIFTLMCSSRSKPAVWVSWFGAMSLQRSWQARSHKRTAWRPRWKKGEELSPEPGEEQPWVGRDLQGEVQSEHKGQSHQDRPDFNIEGPSQRPKLNASSESQEAPDTLTVQGVPGRPLWGQGERH